MNGAASWRTRAALVVTIQGCASIAMLALTAAWRGGATLGVYPLCVLLSALMVWMVISWALLAGTLSDPYGMFLIVLVAFNGGQAALEVLGLNRNGLLDGTFSPEVLAGALVLTAGSLSWLHTGAVIARTIYPPAAPTAEVRDGCAATRRVGWFLLVVGVVPLAFSVSGSLRVALIDGYGALYERDFRTGFDGVGEVLAAFFLSGIYFLVAGAGRNTVARTAALASVGLYTAVRLLIGYRASAVLPLMAFAWLWGRNVAPISRGRVAIGAVLMILIFPLVRLTRLEHAADRMDLLNTEVLIESIGNPLIDVVSETGSTLGVAAYVMELVPSERSHDVGVGYLYALSTAAPNLFWELHPAIANGSYTSWLTRRVNPWLETRGGSYGFSTVAEAYANFGVFAGPLFLALTAFAFLRFVVWAERGDPARAAALALFLAHWLFISRAESGAVVRPLIWYAIAPYVLVTLVRRGGASQGTFGRAVLPAARGLTAPAAHPSGGLR